MIAVKCLQLIVSFGIRYCYIYEFLKKKKKKYAKLPFLEI